VANGQQCINVVSASGRYLLSGLIVGISVAAISYWAAVDLPARRACLLPPSPLPRTLVRVLRDVRLPVSSVTHPLCRCDVNSFQRSSATRTVTLPPFRGAYQRRTGDGCTTPDRDIFVLLPTRACALPGSRLPARAAALRCTRGTAITV